MQSTGSADNPLDYINSSFIMMLGSKTYYVKSGASVSISNYNGVNDLGMRVEITAKSAPGLTVDSKGVHGNLYSDTDIVTDDYDSSNGWGTVTYKIRIGYKKYNHTLYYNANGGSGAPSTDRYKGSSSGHSFTVSSTVPTRPNYVFMGWSESSNSKTPQYHGGDSVYVSGGSSKSLYAVWSNEFPHNLKYNANGGSGAPPEQSVSNASTTHNFTIPGSKPTKSVYSFEGWSESASGPVQYQPGGTIGVNANQTKTLYAIWDAQIRVKVGGQVKEVEQAWCNVGGAWKEVTEVHEKVGGAWK